MTSGALKRCEGFPIAQALQGEAPAWPQSVEGQVMAKLKGESEEVSSVPSLS